jgi:hypothetical protein
MVNTKASFDPNNAVIPNVESAESYVILRDFTISEDALWSPWSAEEFQLSTCKDFHHHWVPRKKTTHQQRSLNRISHAYHWIPTGSFRQPSLEYAFPSFLFRQYDISLPVLADAAQQMKDRSMDSWARAADACMEDCRLGARQSVPYRSHVDALHPSWVKAGLFSDRRHIILALLLLSAILSALAHPNPRSQWNI